MTTERVLAWLVLLGSTYGSVIAVRTEQPSWTAICVFFFVVSVWTVLTLTGQDQFGE